MGTTPTSKEGCLIGFILFSRTASIDAGNSERDADIPLANHRFLVADKRGCASFITAEDLHNLCDVQIADMVAGLFFRHGVNQHVASAVKSLDRALAQNDLRDPLPGQYDGMELAAAGISQGKHIPLSADPGGKEIQKPYC